jgi:hypothetical protein
MGWFTTLAISLTSWVTMGDPATGNIGLGTVKLWGLSLEPLPAMGTIIFNILYIMF